ncbi:hypothetical protein [Streptomyces sp. NRRL S-813]|uniref:hypothetical protein n=1 Tax=Streptomyces sp. NRRL S-813 TaxID=1463919 RepID=UPI0004BF3B00|nr:hypothetical protein [Streptomyces sp. NRRL S-813]
MGERMSGDGARDRRRTHPGGAVSGARDVRDTSALETALAAAIRGGGQLDPEAEQRAVAAFRAARGAGAHRARTRRRDDWRQTAQRRAGRSLKTTFGVVFASLTLGGVAVAAIGSAGSSTHGAGDGRGTAHSSAAQPSAVAPDPPDGQTSSASSGGAGPTGGPAPAQDTEAHCRAYENVEDRGRALDATAWKRLVTAAGGKDKVAAYCSEQLARTTPAPDRPGGAGSAGGAGRTGVGNRATASAATSGNAASGGTGGGTGNAAGNGRTSGGESSGSGGSGGNRR